jgi:hypothetical protein
VNITDCDHALTVREVRLIGAGLEADLPLAGTEIPAGSWRIPVTFTPGSHTNGDYAGMLYVDAEGLAFDAHGKELQITVTDAPVDTGRPPPDTGLPPLDDTGDPPPPPCGITDLVFSAEVRDAKGAPCTACSAAPDVLSFAAIVYNPCQVPLTISTNSSCLAARYSVSVVKGPEVLGEIATCDTVITSWDVPPDGRIEEVAGTGSISAGAYELEVVFNNNAGITASSEFTTALPEKGGGK